MQLKAFSKLPNEQLYIIGDTHVPEYYNKLKQIKPSNVQFLGLLSEEELLNKLSECKGFIHTPINEPFGMAPVEAMASGKPVIAPNEGGLKETIIDGVTGKLIDDINSDKLATAIKGVGRNPEKYKDACLMQAKKFDVEIFIKKMREEIKNGQTLY